MELSRRRYEKYNWPALLESNAMEKMHVVDFQAYLRVHQIKFVRSDVRATLMEKVVEHLKANLPK